MCGLLSAYRTMGCADTHTTHRHAACLHPLTVSPCAAAMRAAQVKSALRQKGDGSAVAWRRLLARHRTLRKRSTALSVTAASAKPGSQRETWPTARCTISSSVSGRSSEAPVGAGEE